MSFVRVKGLEELRRNFQQAPQIAGPIIKRGVQAITAFVFQQANRKNVPWDTGTMVQTFQQDVQGFVGRVYPTVEYALHVHEGTQFQKAQPFLPRMIDAAQDDIDDVSHELGFQIAVKLAKN